MKEANHVCNHSDYAHPVSCLLRDGYRWRLARERREAVVESSWNVMAHGDAREGKWRGNWRMEWVASTLHTTSEHGVSSITTADAHTSAASSRLNWRPRRFKWTRPFRRKTKSDFCACAITFQTQSTDVRNEKCIRLPMCLHGLRRDNLTCSNLCRPLSPVLCLDY